MAVNAQHVGATLRLKCMDNNAAVSLHRMRPDLNGTDVANLAEAVQTIRAEEVANATLHVTTRLTQGV